MIYIILTQCWTNWDFRKNYEFNLAKAPLLNIYNLGPGSDLKKMKQSRGKIKYSYGFKNTSAK